MARKVLIHKQILGNYSDFNIQKHIEDMSLVKSFTGELSHNSEFINPNFSEFSNMSKVAFIGKVWDNDNIMIDLSNTKHGRFLSDLIDNNSDKVKFVPRLLVSNANPKQIDIQIISFDAIINDKELWDRI